MTQDEALSIMKMGHSVFLTGAPGAGKTHLLNKYLDFLYECGVEVAITASTGIAATHIGGMTIHSWAGIGIKKGMAPEDLDLLSQNERLYKRFQNTQVLVIDEISMLGAGQFEMVDQVARTLRRNEEPFGGMQVILSGDFFQLPPVSKGGEDNRYAFQSPAWKELRPVVCYLEGSYRHKDDDLRNFLEAMRRREIDEDLLEMLQGRVLEGQKEMSRDITRLHTHNLDVDAENNARLEEIEGKELVFEMQSRGKNAQVDSLKNWCLAPESLRLKEGAQVMFVKNDPSGRFVNGTRGTVIGTEDGLPMVKTFSGENITADYVSWVMENDGKATAEISQVPLRLAWSITVHKSQGMTLDEAHIDLSKAFAPGQGYVALSRVRSLSGLYISGWNENALAVDPRAAQADEDFKARSEAASRRLSELESREIKKRISRFVKKSGGKETLGGLPGTKKRGEALRISRSANPKMSTYDETRELLKNKMSIEDMARARRVTEKTIMGHLERFMLNGEKVSLSHLLPGVRRRVANYKKLQEAFLKSGKFELTPAKKILEGKGVEATFDQLRLVRLMLPAKEFQNLRREKGVNKDKVKK